MGECQGRGGLCCDAQAEGRAVVLGTAGDGGDQCRAGTAGAMQGPHWDGDAVGKLRQSGAAHLAL